MEIPDRNLNLDLLVGIRPDGTMSSSYNYPKLWKKHKLGMSDFYDAFRKKKDIDKNNWINDLHMYYEYVIRTHDAVAEYWEANPEESHKPYYDAANKVAKETLDKACEILRKYDLMAKP